MAGAVCRWRQAERAIEAAACRFGLRLALALAPSLFPLFAAAQPVTPPAWAYPEGVAQAPAALAGQTAVAPAAQAACTGCHGADGLGTSDSANLTGLSRAYIVRQLREMRSGARQSALPQGPGMQDKTQLLQSLSDTELSAAAAYYVSLPARATLKVVESETVPRTQRVDGVRVAAPGDAQESLDQRIVELQGAAGERLAYVPPGSVARGRSLVLNGAEGRSARCEACHGIGLKGTAIAPVLAGRAPLYLLRQLLDLQHGTRRGSFANQMEQPTQHLSLAEMVALAAYAASLQP